MSREKIPSPPKPPTNTYPDHPEGSFIESTPIRGLLEPMSRMTREMKPFIERGEYGMIIGDDASGRIPTLIMSEVINTVYKKSDRPKINTRFLALYPVWEYQEAWKKLTGEKRIGPEFFGKKTKYATDKIKHEFTDKIDKEAMAGKRVLVVTELLSSGSALRPLLVTLKESGFEFDIACISTYESKGGPEELKLGAGRFFIGDNNTPAIYQQGMISGVIKDKENFNLRSLPIKKSYSPEVQREIQLEINKARQDAHRVASQILDSIWGK